MQSVQSGFMTRSFIHAKWASLCRKRSTLKRVSVKTTKNLAVTFRVIIGAHLEQLRLFEMPTLEHVERRAAFKHGLRELRVVEVGVAHDRSFEVFA